MHNGHFSNRQNSGKRNKFNEKLRADFKPAAVYDGLSEHDYPTDPVVVQRPAETSAKKSILERLGTFHHTIFFR